MKYYRLSISITHMQIPTISYACRWISAICMLADVSSLTGDNEIEATKRSFSHMMITIKAASTTYRCGLHSTMSLPWTPWLYCQKHFSQSMKAAPPLTSARLPFLPLRLSAPQRRVYIFSIVAYLIRVGISALHVC